MPSNSLIDFYLKSLEYSRKNYPEEVKWIQNLKPDDIDAVRFYWEYVWVVLCSGFSVKGARMIAEKLHNEPSNFSHVKHPKKRKAIEVAFEKHPEWFKTLHGLSSDQEKLDFLETLPHIGKVTKYHLGKNIGLDVVKPDVHLTRLAKIFNFDSVKEMCRDIQKSTGYRLPLIDQVLWRYCADHRDYEYFLQGVVIGQ